MCILAPVPQGGQLLLITPVLASGIAVCPVRMNQFEVDGEFLPWKGFERMVYNPRLFFLCTPHQD
jgi:hypothetical protein